MSSQNNIQDEFNELNGDLPPNAGTNPYSVPEGYFDTLASSVLAKIRGAERPSSAVEEISQLSPLLAGIPRTMPYDVPSDYFEEGLKELPVLIRDDEDSVILSLIDKTMPYAVPLGYFASFPDKVLDKISRPKANVVSFNRWMRVAAAAVVTGLIVISGYLYFNGRNGTDSGAPIAQQLKNVSTKELDEFIKTADVTVSSTETAVHSKAPGHQELRNLLHDVSDKELDKFLQEIPTDDEDLSLIN